MTARTSTKHSIAHNAVEGCSLVGVLEQLKPDEPTQGRRIAVILHGCMGHKDYLFQKYLAHQLPLDSFRFDVRGSNESGGKWKFGGFKDDFADLLVVIKYLQDKFGYVIDMLVGHSRGAVVAFHWFCVSPDAVHASALISIAPGYKLQRIYDLTAGWKSNYETTGYYEMRAKVGPKVVVQKIYPRDVDDFAAFDTSLVWNKFPTHVDVLLMHGLADTMSLPYDSLTYAGALSSRTPGTHDVEVVEGADHNFTGKQDEVVGRILNWWELRQRKELKKDVWRTGIRGKL